jgi:hypothetical protein
MLVKLNQWAPDADETDQGILVDVSNMIPSMRGYKGAPAAVSPGVSALAAECRGAGFVTILDGTDVLFAGTQTKLYKGSSTTWTDVTRVASDYTGSASSRWCFAQQGNLTLAVNKVDTSQKYLHGTDSDFADLAAMPKAAVCEAVGEFIMVGNYNDGTDTVDGWACSAIGDYTDWTPSVDTQCVYGRLLDTPGAVTGLKRLADYAIYYKRKSMYLARYVGAPTIWEFSLVSDIIGSVGQESIIKVGTMHYFLSDDDFYGYDTSAVKSIGPAIKEWFNQRCNNLHRHKTVGVHDRTNAVCYWFFPAGAATTPTEFVAYHYKTGRWGRGEMAVEAAAEYVTGGRTYADLLVSYPLYSGYDGIAYEALETSSKTPVPAVFDSAHTIKTLTGVTVTSTMTTNDFGIDDAISLVRRVRPRYILPPSQATIINYYRDQVGSDLIEDATTTENSGRFDFLRAARWHRGKITFTGDIELTALDVEAMDAGKE